MKHSRLAHSIAMLACVFACGASLAGVPELSLMVQRGYLPGIPALIRVEQRKADGELDKALWDGVAELSVDREGIGLSTNRVVLRNGRGSALVVISGAADFNLTATLGALTTTRGIRAVTNEPITTVAGTLGGTATTWSGVVQVTGDVTVPAGHTLTILSNTLVLVNGVSAGTSAPDILISGKIESLGTEQYPVTITCSNANLGVSWGQIRHNTAEASVYRYTSINRGGRAPGEGHTGTGPAVRTTNSRILFDHCNITDVAPIGKIMQGSGSDITFSDCLLSRARMGPELGGTALLCTNTHLIEFRGPDDSDALYVHTQSANQQVLMVDCVVGFTDDDGLDTLGANMTVERSIFRNMNSGVDPDGKGLSLFNGVTHLKRCLIVDCLISVSTKWNSGPAALVTINECTILGENNSVVAAFKSNAPGPFIDYRITNSILRSIEPVKSDFGPTNFTITYCNISEEWPGDGNQSADPLFVGTRDFRLQAGSPCVDAGVPGTTDADGSRIDIGAYTFVPPAPVLAAVAENRVMLNAFPNRNYVLEYSTDLSNWDIAGTFFQTNGANLIQDSSPSLKHKFYRIRLAP